MARQYYGKCSRQYAEGRYESHEAVLTTARSCNDSLSPPGQSKLMIWGREKPKGFIDDEQSYSVVSDCARDAVVVSN